MYKVLYHQSPYQRGPSFDENRSFLAPCVTPTIEVGASQDDIAHRGTGMSGAATLVDCVRATVYRAVYRYEELGEASVIDQRTRREAEKMTIQIQARLLSYQDEADLHLNPKIGATYLKRGQQSIVLTPGKNVKRYIFGAFNARTGRIVSGVVEHKNAAVFVEFLKYLSATYRRAPRLHRVLDNYIIHKAHVVTRHLASLNGRIVLHFLPPYPPDDDVIERRWKQMHAHVTRNHRHKHLDTLVEAVQNFLHNAQPFPGTKVSTLRAAA